jgi:hypothetical protein
MRLLLVQSSKESDYEYASFKCPEAGKTKCGGKDVICMRTLCRSLSLYSPLITTHVDFVIENLDRTDNADAYVNRMKQHSLSGQLRKWRQWLQLCIRKLTFILRARIWESEVQSVRKWGIQPLIRPIKRSLRLYIYVCYWTTLQVSILHSAVLLFQTAIANSFGETALVDPYSRLLR